MFLNFFAYGKFGSHGRFAIYWISGNNGPRCIGATLYYFVRNGSVQIFRTFTIILFQSEEKYIVNSKNCIYGREIHIYLPNILGQTGPSKHCRLNLPTQPLYLSS